MPVSYSAMARSRSDRVFGRTPLLLVPATEETATLGGVAAGRDEFAQRADGGFVVTGFRQRKGTLFFDER